jgi:hypothetical protein
MERQKQTKSRIKGRKRAPVIATPSKDINSAIPMITGGTLPTNANDTNPKVADGTLPVITDETFPAITNGTLLVTTDDTLPPDTLNGVDALEEMSDGNYIRHIVQDMLTEQLWPDENPPPKRRKIKHGQALSGVRHQEHLPPPQLSMEVDGSYEVEKIVDRKVDDKVCASFLFFELHLIP